MKSRSKCSILIVYEYLPFTTHHPALQLQNQGIITTDCTQQPRRACTKESTHKNTCVMCIFRRKEKKTKDIHPPPRSNCELKSRPHKSPFRTTKETPHQTGVCFVHPPNLMILSRENMRNANAFMQMVHDQKKEKQNPSEYTEVCTSKELDDEGGAPRR